MRRFFIAVSLLGLVACGGQVAPESQEPVEAPAAPEASQTEQGVATCSDTWECSCVKHTTQAACQKSWPPCFWAGGKCYPTYE